MDIKLSEQVIGCAVTVSRQLGHGFLEKVYEGALAVELEEARFRTNAKRASLFDIEARMSASIAVISLLLIASYLS